MPASRASTTPSPTDTVVPNVFKDTEDPDPARRYKMITYHWDGKSHSPDSPNQGYHTFVSPDGLHWTRHSEKRLCPGADVITGYYDRQRKLWVALAKITDVPAAHGRRVFWLITSPDFTTWSEPQLVDLSRRPRRCRRDGPHRRSSPAARCSRRARPCSDRILWRRFLSGRKLRPGLSLGFHHQQSGPLRQSRRAIRTATGRHARSGALGAAVPRSLRRARHARRSGTPASSSPKAKRCASATKSGSTTAAPTILHGTPCAYLPDDPKRKTVYTGSIGLAIWPLDRFVSVDGPAEGGRLTTVPLAFTGNRLELNVNAKPNPTERNQSGTVRVELLDAAQKPLPGFGLSDEVKVDSLRHTVTWSGNPDVSAWQGRPVSLRFHLANAELYSFAFREAKA